MASENSTSSGPRPSTDVIIPAFNESRSLPYVLDALPPAHVRRVIVVDNGSTDATAEVAHARGARVVSEPRRGYGRACLTGIDALGADPPTIVVFLDGDFSDHPDELPRVIEPIVADRADLVVGSRVLGRREPGALLPQARFGNWLAAVLIRRLYGLAVTDLGPFRAIRWVNLLGLRMADEDFGWTAEMQVKAARAGLRYCEVPVSYRKRVGVSKISGTLSGSVRAGTKILSTVLRYRPR